jgi:integrase
VFFNERGGELSASTYFRVWREARMFALTPEQVASPMAGKPYDLRHAALSTWLNSGVDPTEVAERAGNSVEVLLSRYAKCLHGRDAAMNRRIEQTLNDGEDQDDVP